MTDAADTDKKSSAQDSSAQDGADPAKPSLKDIAEKDSGKKAGSSTNKASDPKSDAAKGGGAPSGDGPSTGSKPGDAAPKKGSGFVWVVLVLVVIGGAVAAGWPYIGPKVQPVVADLRELMGLGPRPTQATLPDEGPSQTLNQGAPESPATTSAEPEQTQAQSQEQTPDASTAPETDATVQTPTEPAPDQPVSTDVDALATDLDVLKSRVDALASLAGSVSGESAQAALDATAELTRTIAALQGDVQALQDRVAALEDDAGADPTASAQALVLAATQVRARLMGDDPFAAELSALDHIAGADPAVQDAIARLRAHADVGVPTEAALTARFDKVAKAIMTARTTGEAEGWLGRVKDGLGGLVTVRRTDPQAITDDVERAVAVAEAALELGDLAEAVEALGTLQGAPGDAAAAWLGEARARVEAEAALEQLHTHALAALSAAGGQ